MQYDLIIYYTPNEIARLIDKSVCPVCKEKLGSSIESYKIDGLICSYTACLDMADHYNITLKYKDPKHILHTSQLITIIEENKYYHITLSSDDYEHTDIQVGEMDTDEFISKSFYKERIFDFKKFNHKKWVKEIKTIMLLG